MIRHVLMAFTVCEMTVNKLYWNLFGPAQEYEISVLCTKKSRVLSFECSVAEAIEFHLGF